jgi:hypothetical protein
MAGSQPRGSLLVRLLVAVVVVVLAFAGVIAFVTLRDGEARSPSDIADRFEAAGVVCRRYDVISDERDVKVLGCSAEGAQIITITTYGDRPSPEEWLDLKCESAQGVARALQRGFYVVGDDFVLDVQQLPHPRSVQPTPLNRVAARLAEVLDAEVYRYDCSARR